MNKLDFSDDEAVYDCALRMLALREHGGADMAEKLLLKGATQEQADKTVTRLKAAGLINEQRYAMAVYHSWLGKKHYGRNHLLGTLTKKLVDTDCRAAVLAEFTDEIEAQHAEAAAEIFFEKYRRKKFENKRKLWATAAGFMVNRGFGPKYMDLVLGKFTQAADTDY